MIERHLLEHHFRIGVVLMLCFEYAVCFTSFDVVCNVFDKGVWDVCLV